jgi:hypothetical protein
MNADADGAVVPVEYFMIRVHPDRSSEPPALSGVIERLGTGEKLTFAGAAELIQPLGAWPEPQVKMQWPGGAGKE